MSASRKREEEQTTIVKWPMCFIIAHVIPFARRSAADASDPMAIQFMIMNLGIYGRLIIEIRAMARDGARCKFRVRLRVPAVHPSIHASIKSPRLSFDGWVQRHRLTSACIRLDKFASRIPPFKAARTAST